MTEPTPATEGETDPRNSGGPDVPAPTSDAMLGELVDTANHNPRGRLGITVSARGALISGVMIARDTWLERQAELGASREQNPFADLWGQYTSAKVHPEEGDLEWFMHLEDATYIGGMGPVPANGGVLMRVRLSEIDSWAMTFIGKQSAEDPAGAADNGS